MIENWSSKEMSQNQAIIEQVPIQYFTSILCLCRERHTESFKEIFGDLLPTQNSLYFNAPSSMRNNLREQDRKGPTLCLIDVPRIRNLDIDGLDATLSIESLISDSYPLHLLYRDSFTGIKDSSHESQDGAREYEKRMIMYNSSYLKLNEPEDIRAIFLSRKDIFKKQ